MKVSFFQCKRRSNCSFQFYYRTRTEFTAVADVFEVFFARSGSHDMIAEFTNSIWLGVSRCAMCFTARHEGNKKN